MILTVIISLITVISMICVVIFKPYIKIGKVNVGLYYIICLLGAILILITSSLPLSVAISGITAKTSINPLKILALFLSMTILSVFLGDAGFFDYIANCIIVNNKGGKIKLFLSLYFAVSLLTVFTSNDIIILTFTPPICIFCHKTRINPIPFLIGEFIGANTWSMALIVGNPTNVYLATSFGITFTEYFLTMAVPTLVGGTVSLFILLLLFKNDLKGNIERVEIKEKVAVKKVQMIFSLCLLIICIIFLAVSDFIGVPMWIICVISAIVDIIFNLLYELIKNKNAKSVYNVLKKAPYELVPFVLSMFVIVLALSYNNITDKLSSILIYGTKKDGVIFGVLSSVSANFLNNIPMSVLFEKIIGTTSRYALFGAIIGSNIGAFITPVGALAGIMWKKILSENNVNLSVKSFILYGIITAIPTVLLTSFSLLLFV